MQGYNFIVLPATNNPNPSVMPDVVTDVPPTALGAVLPNQTAQDEILLLPHQGARTPRLFDAPSRELDAILTSAAVLDLGWRAKILITGRDRLRWLNGMASNTVKTLPEGEGNYTFVLNTQGRIQGDGYVYRRAEDLVLDTGRDQAPALLRHLQRYIIMDDVKLEDVSERWTALALVGPKASEVLEAAGVQLPPPPQEPKGNARIRAARIAQVETTVIEAYHVLVPHYELWLPPDGVLTVWEALKAAGATPAGLEAAESLRLLEGIPLYGVDLGERDLPQETSQTRALNFTKGCYVGQEIVERIRSRGKVHRQLRQFTLNGSLPPLPSDLVSSGQTVGRITSAASLAQNGLSGNFGLGFVREEGLERGTPLEYPGGIAIPMEGPPQLPS